MARLSGEQQRNIARLKQTAQRFGASRKELKALLEAAAVESNYRHLGYGDRDSVGILQQRPSQGWGGRGESVEQDAMQFLKAARGVKGAGSSGQLAQSVQRSAFPARYDQRSREAESLIGSTQTGGGGGGAPAAAGGADRKALLLQYLQERGRPGALLSLASNLKGAESAPNATKPTSQGSGSGNADIDGLASLAKQMGLRPGENPKYGGVSGGHVEGSFHYSGRALDISGPPENMAKFSREAARRYGKNLKELFYNGSGGVNVDNGKRVPSGFVSGHKDHVHIAV